MTTTTTTAARKITWHRTALSRGWYHASNGKDVLAKDYVSATIIHEYGDCWKVRVFSRSAIQGATEYDSLSTSFKEAKSVANRVLTADGLDTDYAVAKALRDSRKAENAAYWAESERIKAEYDAERAAS